MGEDSRQIDLLEQLKNLNSKYIENKGVWEPECCSNEQDIVAI